MGIDPVTHEPLSDQTSPQQDKPSCDINEDVSNNIVMDDQETNNNNGVICSTSSFNSSLQTENSSTESQPSDQIIAHDDPLMSYLLSESSTVLLEDSSWNFPVCSASDHDYSDFGVSLLGSKDLGDDGELWAWFLQWHVCYFNFYTTWKKEGEKKKKEIFVEKFNNN